MFKLALIETRSLPKKADVLVEDGNKRETGVSSRASVLPSCLLGSIGLPGAFIVHIMPEPAERLFRVTRRKFVIGVTLGKTAPQSTLHSTRQ